MVENSPNPVTLTVQLTSKEEKNAICCLLLRLQWQACKLWRWFWHFEGKMQTLAQLLFPKCFYKSAENLFSSTLLFHDGGGGGIFLEIFFWVMQCNQIAQNCPKLPKIAQNRPKSPKIAQIDFKILACIGVRECKNCWRSRVRTPVSIVLLRAYSVPEKPQLFRNLL
jgi:hypothetical protein